MLFKPENDMEQWEIDQEKMDKDYFDWLIEVAEHQAWLQSLKEDDFNSYYYDKED